MTVATEVPVYIRREDLAHMQTQLDFELYKIVTVRPVAEVASLPNMSPAAIAEGADGAENNVSNETLYRGQTSVNTEETGSEGHATTSGNPGSGTLGTGTTKKSKVGKFASALLDGLLGKKYPQYTEASQSESPDATTEGMDGENGNIGTGTKQFIPLTTADLPPLITGHIDFLQIRNGAIHILDYKGEGADKAKPIEQLTLYALALSRLTGIRVYHFKCAWFDDKNYYEFFPLHVVYKKHRSKRKRITTKEGVYNLNERMDKIENFKPSA